MSETGQSMDSEKRINCFKCEYYANTWNPQLPRACKFFGFKSAQMPSDAVYKSSGEHCKSFKEKIKSKSS
jgi:hypothetical protein